MNVDVVLQSTRKPYAVPLTVLLVVAILVIVVAVLLAPPRWRRRVPELVGLVILGLALVVMAGRGLLEFSIIDVDDPSSYADSLGGPSLIGVLAVHSAPTLILLIATVAWLFWRRARKRRDADIR
jgi:hypothetical protein